MAASLVMACGGGEPARAPTGGRVLAIRGARVFDGERVLSRATVVVRGGTIAAVGADAAVPAGAEVVEAAGQTLLPGLIDAHSHHHDEHAALEQALALGVTTQLGMMEDPAAVRRLRARGGAGRASLRSAGWAVTVAGGLGTEDEPVPTLGGGQDPAAFVAARVAEGSEYIEIMLDDGSGWGRPHPTIEPAALRGAVEAAHRAGRIALVDIATHAEAARAIEAGVDGLAHLYIQGPERGLAGRIARAGAFVIATLPVLTSICDGTRGAALADDPALAPWLMPAAEHALRQSYALFSPGFPCSALAGAVRELAAVGVPILAGTDAGSPGTAHGASLHDALVLLVEAGLSPVDALAAATAAPARAFRLEGIGRIAPGMRADLVLVDGDPTRDVRATRAIRAIWKGGVRVDRERHRARVAAARAGFRLPAAAAGPLGSFEDDDGDGWQARSDQVRGGGSRAELTLIDRAGGGGALQVAGRTVAGAGKAPGWAGAIRFLSEAPPAAVDLAAVRSLRFALRGDGGPVRVMLFTLRGGPVPVEVAELVAGPRWTEHAVSLADRGALVAILFSRGPEPGAFRFELDEVELR